jgi:predicted PilT family ATPase
VQAIVDELRGEKIDIVRFSDTMEEYLKSALSPAKVSRVIVAPGGKSATVIAPDSQLSLAIGRRGQNVRLAAQLTGCHIDIRSESQWAEAPEAIEVVAAEVPAAVVSDQRIRIYELARELGVESRDLVEILQEEGVEVTSHASSITGEQAQLLREMLAGGEGTLAELESGDLRIEG